MYSDQELLDLKVTNRNNLSLIRCIAYTIGMWPNDPYPGWVTKLIFGFNMFCHFGSMYAQISFFIKNVGELYNITEGCCSLITLILTAFKILRFYTLKKSLRGILEEMTQHKTLGKIKMLEKTNVRCEPLRRSIRNVMDQCWKESMMMTKFFFYTAIPVPLLYSAVPFLYNVRQSWTLSQNASMKFPYRTHYPRMELAKNKSPLFEFLFLMETGSGYSTLTGLVIFDAFYVYMILYATGMMKSLNLMLKFSTSRNISQFERPRFMRECVLHHTRVIKFCKQINDVYSATNLMQLITSTLIICLIAFHASYSQGKEVFNTLLMVIYLIASIFQLAMYCFYGQKIIDESSDICVSCYSCNWFECSKHFKYLIQMMLTNAQKPIEIRAWNLSVMSLQTFSAILRSAASYYTALQTLIEN